MENTEDEVEVGQEAGGPKPKASLRRFLFARKEMKQTGVDSY